MTLVVVEDQASPLFLSRPGPHTFFGADYVRSAPVALWGSIAKNCYLTVLHLALSSVGKIFF